MAGRAARGGPPFVINICKLLVVDSNVLDDGGLDQPADGVVVAEVVPAVVFHEARAGDQSREVSPELDGDQRVVMEAPWPVCTQLAGVTSMAWWRRAPRQLIYAPRQCP